MENEVLVSIVCNAYNHEKYIKDALDSFLMQKTNFKFEVLVHDDASTDKTAEIIREYEKNYPEIIKPVYQTENQYSKKVGIFKNFQLPRVQGKYIAVCEGDDYWTDDMKLQKQFDAMEAHPEIDICACGALKVNANTKEVLGKVAPSKKDRIFSVEEVIMGGGGFVATNTLFYRKSMQDNNKYKFADIIRLDYTIQILGSLRGGMYYISDIVGAYRIMADGSWSQNVGKDHKKLDEWVERVKIMLDKLNEETDYRYSDAINYENLCQAFNRLLREKNYTDIFKKEYRPIFNKYPLKTRINFVRKYFLSILRSKNNGQ